MMKNMIAAAKSKDEDIMFDCIKEFECIVMFEEKRKVFYETLFCSNNKHA
jgi:hypothetical protein